MPSLDRRRSTSPHRLCLAGMGERFSGRAASAAAAAAAARRRPERSRARWRRPRSASSFLRSACAWRSQRRAALRHLPWRTQAARPPISTPMMSRRMISANSGSVSDAAGVAPAERVERHRHDLPVGHRESNHDNGERQEDQRCNDLAQQILCSVCTPPRLAALRGSGTIQASPGLVRLSRSRISLPVLKNGTHF